MPCPKNTTLRKRSRITKRRSGSRSRARASSRSRSRGKARSRTKIKRSRSKRSGSRQGRSRSRSTSKSRSKGRSSARSNRSSRKWRADIIRRSTRRVSSPASTRRGRSNTLGDIDFSKLKEPKSMSGVSFNHYIKKVLKKVKPRLNINSESTRIIDRLMKDTLHQIASHASNRMGRRKVLVPKVITRGMRQFLPKDFRLRAEECAQKALTKYKNSKKSRKRY